jgi:hypothetical protein
MLIKIQTDNLSFWTLLYMTDSDCSLLGIKPIPKSFGGTYKVFDKPLFFLAVIKYGIEYKEICEL